MVEKLKDILNKIRSDGKTVSLFAILKMDELTDRWSIIYSSPGLEDEKKRREEFVYLVNLLTANLSEDEARSIARVGVFALDNHLVQSLLVYKPGYDFSQTTPVNGNLVHEGYILESATPRTP